MVATDVGTDAIELHRRFWSEGIDLEVTALILTLHRAHEAVLAPGRQIWSKHGLTPAEFDVLATLRRSPPPRELTPSDIQERLAITSGGLTKVMGKLEERGLVSRSRDTADQRVRPARLTAAGKRLVEKAMAQLTADSAASVRASLRPGEIAALTDTLARLASRHD